jgi:hypothetical protein
LSVPAVKSRLLRARLQLRERLGRYFRHRGDGHGKIESENGDDKHDGGDGDQ